MGVLFGPVAVALPYAIAWFARTRVSPALLTLGAVAFFLVVRLHAYYQVTRAPSRRREVDWWVYNLSLYLPLILFATRNDLRVGAIVYPLALATYLVVVSGYIAWQLLLWWAGAAIDGGQLLYVLAIVPLHLAAFTVTMMAGLGPGAQLSAAGVVGVAVQHYYRDARTGPTPPDPGTRPRLKV